MELSTLLKALRALKGFTQHKVASVLNVSQQAYSQKEKSPDNLTLEELKRITTLYETDLPTLLSGDINKIIPPKQNNVTKPTPPPPKGMSNNG